MPTSASYALVAAAAAALALSAAAQTGTACDALTCPFGFTCIATDAAAPAECLPLNPCLLANCGTGFTCDLRFDEDQCLPPGTEGTGDD